MNDWVFSGNNELRIYCIKGSNAEKYRYYPGNAKVLPFNEFAHNWESMNNINGCLILIYL